MSDDKLNNIWVGSELLKKLRRQRHSGLSTPRLLMTDIDGTFIGLKAKHQTIAGKLLINYLNMRNYGLVAITGRDLNMMLEDYKRGLLPLFDVVITSVGTERYILKNGEYIRDRSYDRYIKSELGFNRKSVYPICLDFLRVVRGRQRKPGPHVLKHCRLSLQPRDRRPTPSNHTVQPPQPYKISFNFFGNETVTKKLHQIFRTLLNDSGFHDVKLVFSTDAFRKGQMRKNIDVLALEKSEAATIIIRELENIMGKVFGIYAGDSMNDYLAINLAGHAAIVVGGAESALQRRLKKTGLKATPNQHIYDDSGRYTYMESDLHQTGPASLLLGIKKVESVLFNDKHEEFGSNLSTAPTAQRLARSL